MRRTSSAQCLLSHGSVHDHDHDHHSCRQLATTSALLLLVLVQQRLHSGVVAASATSINLSARTHAHQDFHHRPCLPRPPPPAPFQHSNAEHTRYVHSDTPTFHDNERNHPISRTSDNATIRTIVRPDYKCSKHPCNGRERDSHCTHCAALSRPALGQFSPPYGGSISSMMGGHGLV